MSPTAYMPISSTAISCSPVRPLSRLSGRPTSVFWLPSVFSTWCLPLSTLATTSFVVVLPRLPVMPTTSSAGCRASTQRARSASAAVVDGTITSGGPLPPGSFAQPQVAGMWSTSAATAPSASAPATKS